MTYNHMYLAFVTQQNAFICFICVCVYILYECLFKKIDDYIFEAKKDRVYFSHC